MTYSVESDPAKPRRMDPTLSLGLFHSNISKRHLENFTFLSLDSVEAKYFSSSKRVDQFERMENSGSTPFIHIRLFVDGV